MHVTKLAAAIIDGKADKYLEVWANAIRTRQRILRDQEAAKNLAELTTGSRVVTTNLRPKYMSDVLCTVVGPGRKENYLKVRFDDDVYSRLLFHMRGRRRYPQSCDVPASCLRPASEVES